MVQPTKCPSMADVLTALEEMRGKEADMAVMRRIVACCDQCWPRKYIDDMMMGEQ